MRLCKGANSGLSSRHAASTCGAVSSGPSSSGRFSRLISSGLASNITPSLSSRRKPCSSLPQKAASSYSCSCTSNWLGNSRRTVAWRTQGCAMKVLRTSSSLMVKKLPCNCGSTCLRTANALLCVVCPVTRIWAMLNAGRWMTRHNTVSAAASSTSTISAVAAMCINRMLAISVLDGGVGADVVVMPVCLLCLAGARCRASLRIWLHIV